MSHHSEENKGAFLPLLLPFRCVVFILVFVIGARLTDSKLSELGKWWSVIASVINIVTIGLIVFAAGRSGIKYKELIYYTKGRNSLKKTVLTLLVFVMIGTGGMYLAGLVCYGSVMPSVSIKITAPIPVAIAAINLVVLPLTVPFAEDGLYLGCGTGRIDNKLAAIIIPSFFYAFQHCFIPTLFDAKYMIYRFLSFLPSTVVFCCYFYKKKDPLPIMISHAVLDLATASTIFIMSVMPEFYEKALKMV